jgi:predicted component of type VI protein secretion system
MAYLIIYIADAPAHKVELAGPAVVGRAMGCEVWLDDRRLSRQHCRIEPRESKWVLRDLDSTNGTFVHRQRIREVVLAEGDTIEVGKARIVFREGQFVGRRPLDPIDAASQVPRPVPPRTPAADLENTTIMGQRLPQVRVTVAEDIARPRDRKVALPFRRPPAQPIVQDDSSASSGWADQSSRWLSALVSRFRRK